MTGTNTVSTQWRLYPRAWGLLALTLLALACSNNQAGNTQGTVDTGLFPPQGDAIIADAIDGAGTKTDGADTVAADVTDDACTDDNCGATDDACTDCDADDAGSSDDAATDGSSYSGPACTTQAACKGLTGDGTSAATPWCNVGTHQCVECLYDAHCAQGSNCIDYKCTVFQCKPGSQVCNGTTFLDICNADGASTTTTECPPNKPTCYTDSCHTCEPNKQYCGKVPVGQTASKTVMQCNDTGAAAKVLSTCSGDTVCLFGKCQTCVPGQQQCNGDKALSCKADGSGYDTNDCSLQGWTCLGGLCVNPCNSDFKSNTNVGCDYWAVDLDNVYVYSGNANPDGTPKYFDAQNAQFSVIISNTKDKAAQVTVTAGTGMKSTYTVPKGALKIINLPDPTWKVKPLNQDGTNRNKAAYRIQSSQPIVAYQFNPLQNQDVFSNDASLLLPTNGIGNDYFIMTREQTGDLRGYFNIVSTQPGKTHCKITASATTSAGACYKDKNTGAVVPVGCTSNVTAMKKGDLQEFDLDQGEVLNIETNASAADLTGSYISCDYPVVVFGGSESSNSPNTDHCVNGVCEYQGWACTTNDDCPRTCCQDHLEEQLFPISTWGTKYLATKFQPRGNEKDTWRILASQDGTNVTTSPVVANVPVLNKGQWYEFETDKDFSINADKPILVGQFMAAANAPDPNSDVCTTKFADQSEKICTSFWNDLGSPQPCKKNADCPNIPQQGDAKVGDPDFSLLVPSDKYLSQYVFLVPNNYDKNYVNIIAPVGGSATLDGQAIDPGSFTPFSTGWTVARLEATPGSHTLTCPTLNAKNCGLVVYGWAPYVSYSYPGGVMLK